MGAVGYKTGEWFNLWIPNCRLDRYCREFCVCLNVSTTIITISTVFVYNAATVKGFYVNTDHRSTNPNC